MNSRASSKAHRRPALLAVLALGLAATASAALAQATPDRPAAPTPPNAAPSQPAAEPAPWPGSAPVPPNSVEGVTVGGRRPQSNGIPDDKAAAYNAEVAKAKAWKDYRKSMPRATSDPNDLSQDYPGLQTLLPPKQ